MEQEIYHPMSYETNPRLFRHPWLLPLRAFLSKKCCCTVFNVQNYPSAAIHRKIFTVYGYQRSWANNLYPKTFLVHTQIYNNFDKIWLKQILYKFTNETWFNFSDWLSNTFQCHYTPNLIADEFSCWIPLRYKLFIIFWNFWPCL